MAINDVYQVALRGFNGGQPIVVTSQYRTQLSIGDKALEMSSLLEAVEDNWLSQQLTDDLPALCHSTVQFRSVTCYDLINQQFGAEKEFPAPYYGEQSGQKLPTDMCMYVKKSSGLRGRSRRGINYLPVGTEDHLSGGLWTPAFIDAVTSWMDAATKTVTWQVNFAFEMIVYSVKYGYSNPITSFSAIPEPRRQKRRRSI